MVTIQPDHVTFELTLRHANSVFVVGDFNEWDEQAHPMHAVDANRWRLVARLIPGAYRFRYLAHFARNQRQWITDYAAFGLEPNRVSGWDSVLWVPAMGVEEAPRPYDADYWKRGKVLSPVTAVSPVVGT